MSRQRLSRSGRASLRDSARRVLDANRRTGVSAWESRRYDFVCPSASHYPFQWFWDSCFHAIALCHHDPQRAAQELRGLVAAAQPSGFIPHMVLWEKEHHLEALGRYNIWLGGEFWTATVQPPVLAQALERVYQVTGDRALLDELLPPTLRFYRWLLAHRDPDQDGLLAIIQPDESGLDASPKYDELLKTPSLDEQGLTTAMGRLFDSYAPWRNDPSRLPELDVFSVEDVLYNSIYAQGLSSLARFCGATEAGPGEADELGGLAAKVTAALVEKCWDAERAAFWDLAGQAERPLKVLTITSLLPLILPDLPAPIAQQLVERHLFNPAEFWLPYPVPSVAASEPSFDPSYSVPLIWRGPTWVNTNWFLVGGLRSHGFLDEAEQLAERTLSMVARSGFREFYDPFTAEGYGAASFGWTTLVLDLLDPPPPSLTRDSRLVMHIRTPNLTNLGDVASMVASSGRVKRATHLDQAESVGSREVSVAYRPYRGHRRRRGPGWGFAVSAVIVGLLVVVAAWYLHVPMPTWVGYKNVEALQAPMQVAPEPTRESASPHLARGDEAMAAGRWAEAVEAYARAVQIDPILATAQARWARALLYQSHLDEAVDRAQRAADVDPRSAEARAVLAQALDWSGQVDRAVQIAHQAVDLDSSYAPALNSLAEAYTDQYRLREADEVLDRALGLAPQDPEVFRVQGNLRETRSDYAGAVSSYRRALELAPAASYLYVSLGHALRAQKLYDEALEAFSRATELAPTDARAEGGLGIVYAAKDDSDQAIAHLRRAIEIDPRYPTAYAQLAWIFYSRRDYEQASPLFEKAIDLDRDPGRVAQYRHALGWIFLNGKRMAEAREQFTRALELNPGLQGAKDGLALLQNKR
ncbi:MAG TPA: tetratricopeptide repeat protein [Chloroflexota bacterium]|nr:tetratricopeptide repeat protein [Chloroflexota bacterium]